MPKNKIQYIERNKNIIIKKIQRNMILNSTEQKDNRA